MLSRFRNLMARFNHVDPGDRILLAVSGGLDSMVMLKLFQQSQLTIAVAHANFQLRGAESDRDQAFVQQYCKHAGISFFSKAFDTNNYAEGSGLSIQMAARELRYTWFGELLVQEKYHWLATAHHLNDNLETVLMRWAKGAGLEQLAGIPLSRDKIIRPMLYFTRTEIEDYAVTNKISWREDRSNETDDYMRNFIRHQIVPKLKEINPGLEETFAKSIDKLKGAAEQMHRGLEQLRDGITRAEGKELFIDTHLLLLLKNPVFVCYEWLRPYGFGWDRCVQLVEALGGQPGSRFLSPTHQVLVDREAIIVSPLEQSWLDEILVEEGQDKAALGPWILFIHKIESRSISADADRAALDLDRVRFPLRWRKWRSGDVFHPLGLGHRKKVSDFLIDDKVPMTRKNTVTVIESGGEIVWVVGHRLDDRFKVTAQTKSVLEMNVRHI